MGVAARRLIMARVALLAVHCSGIRPMTRLTLSFIIGFTLMWGVLGTWQVMR